MRALHDRLATITCTLPWTLDDSRDLYELLKPFTNADEKLDVYNPRGDQVIVTIMSDTGDLVARKVYDAV